MCVLLCWFFIVLFQCVMASIPMSSMEHPVESSGGFPPVVSVGGAMDGVRVPANQLEMVKALVVGQLGKYSGITKTVRPWREFIVVARPPTSADVVAKKIQTNVVYYQSNYIVLVSIFLIISILTTPSCLFLFAVLGAGWGFLLKKNEDPTYMLVIAGVPLGKPQRTIAASVVSGILILIFAGSLILSVLGLSAVVVAAHAALNNSNAPTQLQNIEEDDPINQI